MRLTLLGTLPVLLLTACGGSGGGSGDDSNNESTPTFSGYFLDAAVENLNYTTATQSGKTDAEGKFIFQQDERINFSIGNIGFPEIDAATTLTPLDLFSTDNINDPSVVNSLRLLQSLDDDGDLSNGIRIPEQAHLLATALNIDFSSPDFESQISDFIANTGAVGTTLISANQAISHFQATLDTLQQTTPGECTQAHQLVGSSADFSTLAHQVSGTATIIDDCTIEVTNFSYDGSAPQVYFYAARDNQYTSNDAFAVSQQLLVGRAYNSETVQLRLPTGKTLDDLNSISVWCVEFSANFGEVNFKS
ncbi:hypothetical protein GCM10007916_29440 [Psychromonas marina]|uniref:DM13 domain-containing protein n=1 Tax=Psychromonas marina TaxID=88364 RepID=A0ABQ6E385_9GAMM|nr:DM13 domain-containing protein [Psychromonas marina]GLS91874.1 hypothetical protein GCM10007916_29440 [Psychromonas marina]